MDSYKNVVKIGLKWPFLNSSFRQSLIQQIQWVWIEVSRHLTLVKRLKQTFIQSVKTATPTYLHIFPTKGRIHKWNHSKGEDEGNRNGNWVNLQSMTWVTRGKGQSFGKLSWRHLWMAKVKTFVFMNQSKEKKFYHQNVQVPITST